MSDLLSDDSSLTEFERSESTVRLYCRDMPAIFTRGLNALLWDESGAEYIDFLAGCGSLNYGHNHPRIKSAVLNYLAHDGIVNSLDLHTHAKRNFLTAFREIILSPRELSYRIQFTGPTGTNAVEAALKLARKITGRRTIVAFSNGFHGMTLGALSASARRKHQAIAGLASSHVIRLPFEGYLGAGTAELDRYAAMARDDGGGFELPAAFIVETVQGEGGLNTASPAWLRHLAHIASDLGALLIVDDIQAGCGRTGDFFGFEQAGIRPDIVCLSKSIGGMGLPMALVLIKPEHDRWEPGEHTGTFRGNNLAFVAGTAALEFWRDPLFAQELTLKAVIIRDFLQQLVNQLGQGWASLKGRGLLSGIAFVDHSVARRAAAEAFRRNVLIETCGPYSEVLKILPPLTIEADVLREGLRRVAEAVCTALGRDQLRPAA